MRNCKKEQQLLADLGEAILQFRINDTPAYVEHLKNIRRQVKKMI